MASIQTGIQLSDNFTAPLMHIINSVNMAVTQMEALNNSMNSNIDTTTLEGVRNELNQATISANQLNEAMQNISSPSIQRPDIPDAPTTPLEPITQPVQWETNNLDVFSTSGIERYQQEIQSANQMLDRLSNTQNEIARQSANSNILPPNAQSDMSNLASRIDNVRNRIQQIENNPLNFGTNEANQELEQLRSQLNQAVQQQEELNRAIQDMDVSAANDAYIRLSQTVSNTERYIRDNADSQGHFNQQIEQGTAHANEMMSTIKRVAAAYLSIQTIGNVVNISDDLVQTRARLDMMNDGLQSTDYLVKMVYASAQDARGEFGSMADVVARFGNNAKDAFGSTEEVVAFANLVQKQMTIAGASTQEASNAMLQLSQALGSGVLRGDELNSIFEQAPNLIQNIADYLNVPIGKIREMASEGQLSASIVKNAIFAATDKINADFESMPMTWGQVWTSFQNSALMAFEPVLNKINELANNDEFQNSLNSVMNGLSSFASFTLDAFNMVIQSIGFVADNWNTLMPIIVGVTSAVIAYKAAHTGMQIISSIVSATAAAYGIEASQVTAATVAQYGLNAALNACPFVAILSALAGVGAGIAYVNNEFGSLKITLMVFEQIFKTIWENFLYFLTIVEVKVAEFVASFISGFYEIGQSIPVSLAWAKAMALTEIQDMVNGAIDLINDLINTVNKIPGVSLETIQHVTFGTDAQIEASVAEAAANANIAEFEQQQQANVDAVRQWSDSYGAEIAKNQADREAAIDKAMTEQANAEKNQNTFDYNKYLNFKQKDFSNGQAANIANSTAQTAANTADAANNTAKVADAVAVTAEDLKYLRDMAEAETINRFTTASITVNQTNHNTVNNDMDLDGVTEHLRSTMEEQMAAAAEGVH